MDSHADFVDATQLATWLMGDAIAANLFLLGFAFQKGCVPLTSRALLRAIEINAVAVKANQTAFQWGRKAALDLAGVQREASPQQTVAMPKPVASASPASLIADRVATLTAYQDARYAKRYADFVAQVQLTESQHGGKGELARAVASNLFKLMAYKDEYEVARLHTDGSFHAKVNAMFEGDFKLNYHLAPPLMAKKNAQGELQKQKFGPWMLSAFGLLAKFKFLRGSALDPFGHTEERKMERALIAQYLASIEELLPALTLANHAAAVEVARIPELIKGYGHVKARHVAVAQQQWTAAMLAFHQPASSAQQLAA